MKKKLLSLVLALSLVLSMIPTALATETGESAEQQEIGVSAPAQDLGGADPASDAMNGTEGGNSETSSPEQNTDETGGTTDDASGVKDPEAIDPDQQEPAENTPEVQIGLLSAAQSTVTLGSAAAAAGLVSVSQTHHAIANGVTYDKIVMRNKNDHQAIGYLTEIDLSKNVKLKATYDGYYTAGSTKADRVSNAKNIHWSMKETTKLAADYGTIADPEGTVVMATNGDYFNMGTGEPTGYLVMEGNVVKTSYEPYFAILKDGTAVIRDSGTPLDDVEEAISGPFYLLKNGEIQQSSDGAMNPRNSVGIRADGSVVFFMAEGRLAPRSIGMDYYEVASVLKDAGCVTALYLDGGGSATFAAREEGGELKMLSKPSDGQERTISSGILCISTESQDGIFHHAAIAPRDELYTPGSSVQFTAAGVDRSGGAAELPQGLVWRLSVDSAAMGSIDNSGLFTANADSTGVVTVELLQGEDVVGTASIEIVKPDSIYFNSDEISLDFEQESNLGLVVRYQNRDVNIKNGDIIWAMSDEKMGSFTGNLFTSADGYSVTANITATSAFDATVTSTIKTIIGMLPTVAWDFEDHTNDDGTVTSAQDYYCGENGILSTSNYGWGGKESIEIVSIDDGEPVRFGSHALKLNFDFSNCGAVTEGACVGSSAPVAVPGVPTGLGVWVYAPEGVGIEWKGEGTNSGLWLRAYAYDKNGKMVVLDYTFEPKSVTNPSHEGYGQQPGIYWEGWKYCEAKLSAASAPFSLQPGMTFRLMFVHGTQMVEPRVGSIYLDNFQFVYGTNTDDIDNPQVDSITFNNEELVDGGTVYGSRFDLRAYFSDAPGKYARGVDASTVRLYVDGVNVTDKAVLVAGDGHIDLYDMQLTNGTHSVTVSLRDGFGNETSETRYFTVTDSSAENLIRVTSLESMAAVGGYVTLEIRGTNSTVSECDMVIRLDRQYSDCEVTFSKNFTAPDGYDPAACYNAKDHTVTVQAVRAGGRPVKDGNLIATVKVKVPDNLTASSTFLYEVRSGMCYNMDGDLTTFSAPAVTLPVGAAISVSCSPVLTGQDAVLTVTDLEGNPVSNAEIYGENDALLGKTGKDGTLTSNAFTNAGVVSVYAKAEDGSLSMRYRVYTYAPVTDMKTEFLFNATGNGGTTKNITWLSDPTATEGQYLRWRVQGTEKWTATIPASTELRTFTGGGYKAANVNSVTLGGLTAGMTYEYQVAAGKENWPETVESFTASTAAASQKFFVLGDIQANDTTNISNIFEKLRAGSYDFGIQTGDAVDSPTNFTKMNEMVDLLNAAQLGSADVIHVLGNHEFEGDGNADIAGSVFALPAHTPGSCWSTTYGNVYVAVINYSGIGSDMKAAAEWLVQDAQASNATWKILTVHQPAYYTNTKGGNGPMTQYIPAAVEEAGIDVVFSGHDHSFARTNPLKGGEVDAENGVYYYICGSSGEKSYAISSQDVFDYDKIFAQATTDFNAVYLSVETSKTQMTINVYDVLEDGSEKLLDSLTMKSTAGSCADRGHSLDNPVCSGGKLICNYCHEEIDPAERNFTGWARDEATGRKMYFLRGTAQTGWFLIGEDNYCFDTNGVAYDGQQVVDEVPLVFDNGLVVSGHTGFITKSNGKTYYYNNGRMALGMTDIDGELYYFESDEASADYGAMVTGWRFIPGIGFGQCYFHEDGHMHRFIKGEINAENSMITVVLSPLGEARYKAGRVAVWSQRDGQDDLRWFNGEEQEDGTWIVTVPMCLYKDTGRYSVHGYDGGNMINAIYIDVDKNVTHKFTNYVVNTDNCMGAETKIAQCDYGCGAVDKTGWLGGNHTITAAQNGASLSVRMTDAASHGHTKVRFAVWSVENDQDDLVWYDAIKQLNGTWGYTVDLTKHKSVGPYQIHAYACTGSSDTFRMAGHTIVNVAQLPDKREPSVTAEVSSDFSTMQITVENASEYSNVLLPVWSEENGQDDLIWYDAEKQADGTWMYAVDLTKHHSIGRYQVHVYTMKDGAMKLIARTTANVAQLPVEKAPVVTAVVSSDFNTMQITVENVKGYDRVLLPVWSEAGGQDDLVWYNAEKQADGTWTYTVDLTKHNSTGRYQIHVYTMKSGTMKMAASTSVNVAQLPMEKAPVVTAVVSSDFNTMQITVENVKGYDRVLLPVWSEAGGQDDLVWYNAEKQADSTWTYTVDLTKHNSTGRYQIHVYTGKDGAMKMLANTSVNVTQLPAQKAPTVTAVVSSDFNTMQITVKNAEEYSRVLLPVWSEVNDQDDLVWYNAKKQADGTWTYTVNLRKHNSAGWYQIHVYGKKNGTQELITSTRAMVARIPE